MWRFFENSSFFLNFALTTHFALQRMSGLHLFEITIKSTKRAALITSVTLTSRNLGVVLVPTQTVYLKLWVLNSQEALIYIFFSIWGRITEVSLHCGYYPRFRFQHSSLNSLEPFKTCVLSRGSSSSDSCVSYWACSQNHSAICTSSTFFVSLKRLSFFFPKHRLGCFFPPSLFSVCPCARERVSVNMIFVPLFCWKSCCSCRLLGFWEDSHFLSRHF